MDSANLDFAHEFVRKIESRFHFCHIPQKAVFPSTLRNFKNGRNLLDWQPGDDRVGDRNFVNIAALQFDDEVARIHRPPLLLRFCGEDC